MFTPQKSNYRVLNNKFTPFEQLSLSQASTNIGKIQFDPQKDRSSSRKKFSRKRDSSSQSGKLSRKNEAKKVNLIKDAVTPAPKSRPYQRAEDLITRLHFKKQQSLRPTFLKMSAEKSDSESFHEYNSSMLTPRFPSRKSSRICTEESLDGNFDLEMELEMKNSELEILSDQNERLNKKLKKEQESFEKQKAEYIQKCDQKVQSLSQKINILEVDLKAKNQQILANNKTQKQLKSSLKKSQNEVEMLKLHADSLMKKNLPKNVLEMQSYRQKSLNNQIQALRAELSQQKQDCESDIQMQLSSLKSEYMNVNERKRHLEIQNHILSKKANDGEINLSTEFKKQLTAIKEKLRLTLQEMSSLKKENVRLRQKVYSIQMRTPKKSNSRKRLWSQANESLQVDTSEDELTDDSFSLDLSR